jgi:L-aminopeptidase/D-esterase-like protein
MSGRITDIPGVRVGHAGDTEGGTGCTVVLGPFRAAADVRGTATGTRELGTLSPLHVVGRADAILLTGGSAFGLAAADGVVAWLEERGRGYDTGVARVPIVPAAVIFDLAVGRTDRRPDAAMGRAACEAAGIEVAEGRVGAGTGATVGKALGPGRAMPGGLGTAAVSGAGHTVGALAVVNALGDVLDREGRIIAGALDEHGRFADCARLAREGGGGPLPAGTNTTLCVVATDAPLDRTALRHLARAGSTAQARRLSPAHTPFDGDVTFAISPTEPPEPVSPRLLLALAALAAHAVALSIENAVGAGTGGVGATEASS